MGLGRKTILTLIHNHLPNKGGLKMEIHVIDIGDFAHRVTDVLVNQRIATRTKVIDQYPVIESLKLADCYLLISSHPCVTFSKKLEDYAYKNNGIFLPVILDHPYLTIGPLSNYNDDTACYHCSLDRKMQHDSASHASLNLFDYYDQFVGVEPKGYRPSDITMLGYWLQHTLIEGLDDLVSTTYLLNIFSREAFTSKVIGVHGCERCGSQQEQNRSYENLWNLFNSQKYMKEGLGDYEQIK